MSRFNLLRVLVIFSVVLSTSAYAVQADRGSQACPSAKASYRIGFASLGLHTPYRDLVSAGIEEAARKSGKMELAVVDEQQDAAVALARAKEMTAQPLDGVVGYPGDDGFGRDVMKHFQNTQLSMISIDAGWPGATFVGANIRRAGLGAGETVADWVNQNWEKIARHIDYIVVLDSEVHTSVPSGQLREILVGLQNNLKTRVPDDHVITLYTESTRDAGYAATLQAYRRADLMAYMVILAMDDARALGALAAIDKLVRTQWAIVIGQHSTAPGPEEIARYGSIYLGANNYFPEKYGEKAIQTMLDLLECKSVSSPVYTDDAFITKFNLCNFYPDGKACAKLRSRGFPATSSLDPDVANRLILSMDSSIQLQPGESYQFRIGLQQCCVYFEEVRANVTWSVSPTQGATIDP